MSFYNRNYSPNSLWQRFIVSSPCNVLLWAAALAYGGYVSVFSSEIRDITPISWERSPNWYFWLAIVIFLILLSLFSARSSAIEAKDENTLKSIITSPPADFLEYFARNYDQASNQLEIFEAQMAMTESMLLEVCSWLDEQDIDIDNETLPPSGQLEDIDIDIHPVNEERPESRELVKNKLLQAYSTTNAAFFEKKENGKEDLRFLLVTLIDLVNKWDARNRRSHKIVYRANIMKVFYYDEMKAEEAEKWHQKASKFSGGPFSDYSGIVILEDNELTTATDTPEPIPDADRKPIAFPFTLVRNQEKPKHQNLLGAPIAVAERSYSYLKDIGDIYHHYSKRENTLNWSCSVERNLKQYYLTESTGVAHSLLSIPLTSAFKQERVKWVVNIYRDQDGLLFNGEKVSDFLNIIEPYLVLIRKRLYIQPE